MLRVQPPTIMPQPRHPKARVFAHSGLFDRVSAFCDLEDRIAALPTEKERGDAFEVFAEAYLALTRSVQTQQVWPFDAIPDPVLQHLLLDTGKDMGVDGAIHTTSGDYCAYQVKFRSHRPALAWRELATFMGLTDHVGQRVLLTNCDAIPAVMNERSNFYCIRGTDLDQLTSDDFTAFSQWLRGGRPHFERKTPRPHQEEAVAAIVAALKRESRVTSVMASGTGKTLVALWTAERLGARQILVLVPSLALIRQTLHEWLRQTSWERVSYRCVCSDPQVSKGADELIVHQSDLDFPVTTNSDELAEYLAKFFDGSRVIFSTYQSATVVAEAMKRSSPFDVAIFDEAHKTAGRQGAKFGFALHNENLPIKKRVFLTATPRHYDVSRQDKEGDAKVVYSMDVPESYGPIVHTLNYAKAARLEIICNYKVIISVVTKEMVTNTLLRSGEVIVDGDAVKVSQVATQIALEKAVSKHGINRIFTFHSRISAAKSFTSKNAEGIGSHLTGFDIYHVNGRIRTAVRDRILRQFAAADRGLVSNARCLTEGVDVPAVDMVAFMAPKRSRIDIVQAAGRAMRKDPERPQKTTGFILIPLFVQVATDESIEDAIQRTGFDEVWSVLEALQEQDEVLAEVIRQMREDKGRTGGFDDSRFRDKVEILSPSLKIDELRSAIAARCVERLAAVWDERFGELRKFKESHGHCSVPQRSPDNARLGQWIRHQRTAKKRGTLVEHREQRLEEIGFAWDPLDVVWDEMFVALQEYRDRHGDCEVPRFWAGNRKLGQWVSHQRRGAADGQVSEERVGRLESLGFTWDRIEAAWERMFSALQDYKANHGHCNVPSKWPTNPELGTWVHEQRKRGRQTRGQLSPEHVNRLEAIGFDWDPMKTAWEEMFSELVEYKAKHGNCNVPQGSPDYPKLAIWVPVQRRGKVKGMLSPEDAERLEALGFVWDRIETAWEEMFAALKEYKAKHGDCNVPAKWPENLKLGRWVFTQRTRKRKGGLSSERVKRLEEIGFVWGRLIADWEEMFAALSEYKAKYGHCDVTARWPENPKLGRWVFTQRKKNAEGQLDRDRVKRLDEIGFAWENKRKRRRKSNDGHC